LDANAGFENRERIVLLLAYVASSYGRRCFAAPWCHG